MIKTNPIGLPSLALLLILIPIFVASALAEGKSTLFQAVILCEGQKDGCTELKDESKNPYQVNPSSKLIIGVKEAHVIQGRIEFDMDEPTRQAMAELTEKNIGKQLALVVDTQIVARLVIAQKITSPTLMLPVSGNLWARKFEICKNIFPNCPNGVDFVSCQEKRVRIQFLNKDEKYFPFADGECSDTKIAPDGGSVGWVITDQAGTGPRSSILYIIHFNNIVRSKEGIRLLNWRFGKNPRQVLSQWSTDGGSSIYFLYDLSKGKNIEKCESSMLKKCPRIMVLLSSVIGRE